MRVLNIRVRTKFIFKARNITQYFSKFAPPDRNNIVTSFFDFLLPRHCFLVPVLQCFISVANGFRSIGHAKAPIIKTAQILKDLISVLTIHINFCIRYPSQVDFPPITSMNNVSSPPNISQPLKTLNRLTIPHTITRSRDNIYSVRFHEHGSEHLIANGRYCKSFPKGVHLNQFQIQISKHPGCQPQYIHVIPAVGQQFALVADYLTCLFLVPFENLGALINRQSQSRKIRI